MTKRGERPDRPASALNLQPGVSGSHDGLSGDSPRRTPRAPRRVLSVDEYFEGVRAGDRGILGQAITLVESNAAEHQRRAQELLSRLLPFTGNSIRVGITGVPGAGKSTLIERLGGELTGRGHKVAVLAVDPSSSRTRGSILGDKTRMEELSRDPRAFIRPSPSGGTLGGVARKTRESILVFEAAGFEVLLVETVGVGQSEITVRSMVDYFLLVLIAGAGDELQGIKRGVIEIADGILINKADGENRGPAETARHDYERAIHYLPEATEGWTTPVRTCSAREGSGIVELWETIREFERSTRESGSFADRRRRQTLQWMHGMVRERLEESFYRHEKVRALLGRLEEEVLDGRLPATQAAWRLLDAAGLGGDEPA